MTLHPVKSANVEAIGHDPVTNKMRVRFHGGAEYEYHDVPAKAHQALLDAASIGKHLNAHVRGRYKTSKLK